MKGEETEWDIWGIVVLNQNIKAVHAHKQYLIETSGSR